MRARLGALRRSVRARLRIGAGGPRAVYARILDGEHLWLAVPAGAGRPALWDPRSGAPVPLVDDLPDSHVEHDGRCVSVRWRLPDTLPDGDGAGLLVVLLTDSAKPRALRPPQHSPRSNLKTPLSADGRSRFVLNVDGRGRLRVLRQNPGDTMVLTGVRAAGESVRISFAGSVAAPVELLLLDREDRVVRSWEPEHDGASRVVDLRARDLPLQPGVYRFAVGTPQRHVMLKRRRDDLRVQEPTAVLLPLLLDPETSQVVGRLQFNAQGVLRVVRRPTEEESAAEVTG